METAPLEKTAEESHPQTITSMQKTLLVFAVVLNVVLSPVERDTVAAPPENFQREVLVPDLDQAMNFDFIPEDGRILVLQKTGEVQIVHIDTIPATVHTYMTLTDVETRHELGLQDLTFDPDFHHNGFVYIYYQHKSTQRSRISRFIHEGDTADPETEVLIWESNAAFGACCHYGGGLEFSPIDGTLFFTTGDEGDPGATQSLTRTNGKVMRINIDGSIPEDNPFFDGPGPNLDEIYCLGLRNPFRGGFDPETGRYILGEVGQDQWENIYQAEPGANFGWPICEGNCVPTNPIYTDPIHSYAHVGPFNAQGNGSAIGGDVYRGRNFPSLYEGVYFYGDFAQGWIRYLTFDEEGQVNGDVMFDNFLPEPNFFPALVAIHLGPDGALYVLFMDANLNFQIADTALYRYVYDDGSQGPQIVSASADVTSSPTAPLTVHFNGVATDSDTPGFQLDYRWILDDDTELSGQSVSYTFTKKGNYTARLVVSDDRRSAISDPIDITVGTPPRVTITSPVEGSLFRGNDAISYSATATVSGNIEDATFEWTIRFLHDQHSHPVEGPLETMAGVFNVPVTGHDFASNTGFGFILEVTDGDGLSSTETVSVFPTKVDVTFDTDPSGLPITIDGIPRATPLVLDSMIGFEHSVSARASHCENSLWHTFDGWSDGNKAVAFTFVVPNNNTSLIATYSTAAGSCVGGTFLAPRVTITVDGDLGEWANLSAGTQHQITENNSVSGQGGREHDIRYAWDDDNLYVSVEETVVDETIAEGANANNWYALAPWSTDSVGFYDSPTIVGGPSGPGPNGATGPVTQFWVGMASDGDPGRHMARTVPEDQSTGYLITEKRQGVSVHPDGRRVSEFFMPWSEIKFPSEGPIEPGFTFRMDPLMVDGIANDGSFNGQSYPDGSTNPAVIKVEDMSFVKLAGSAPIVGVPVAEAGPGSISARMSEVVVLDGSASSDSDNGPSPLTFEWTFESIAKGSALNDSDIFDARSAVATFTPDSLGTYTVQLRVSDGQFSAVDSISILVTGGTFLASKSTVTVDGDLGDWDDLESDAMHQITVNNPVSGEGGRQHDIRYAWDDDNLYVSVEETVVDETIAEGANANNWYALAPWSTDSVGFYDSPTIVGGPSGPGPNGATGPVTQFWVGMASDGDPGRHMARTVPEDQSTGYLITEKRQGVSVHPDGRRVSEFFMPWSEIKFPSEGPIEPGFTFRMDPLMVDGIANDGSFNGQSYPDGSTSPAVIEVEDITFVTLGGPPGCEGCFRRGDGNADNQIDISDAVHSLEILFGTAERLSTCDQALDYNADDTLGIVDPLYLLFYMAGRGQAPDEPFGACGLDPRPSTLSCDEFAPCDLGQQ